jgi:hypothetical protein
MSRFEWWAKRKKLDDLTKNLHYFEFYIMIKFILIFYIKFLL